MRKIFYIIFALLGVSILMSGFFTLQETKKFLQTAETVQGRVLAQDEQNPSPRVVFSTSQGNYITITLPSLPGTYSLEQGEQVELLYLSENPEGARIRSFYTLYPNIIGSFLFGSLLLIFGIGRFLYFFAYQKKLIKGQKNFQKLQGVVTKTSSFFPFYTSLHIEIHYPKNSTTLVFQSPLLWRPNRFIKPGQSIPLYIDQKKTNRYYIDIPHLSEMI